MPANLLNHVNMDRLIADALQLVKIASPTGDTQDVADHYERLLTSAGCNVVRYEFVPRNPTLVATYAGEAPGKTVLFNGHMDTIPLAHEPAEVSDGRIYGRGSNDMKGSLACIVEVLRVLNESGAKLKGNVVIVANSLHESPGGRGEDLFAFTERAAVHADAAIVMEGATRDCTVAQFGSATFRVVVRRDGEPSHQLYTPAGTPHPIHIAAAIISALEQRNVELERDYVEDIGCASYFVGSVHSGQFYNQFPNEAELVGVRRYGPEDTFAAVHEEFRSLLDRIADAYGCEIELILEKVRDGYRIDKNDPAVHTLVEAVRKVRNIPLPLVGKKLVTDAGIFANHLSIPTLCHGPDQRTAHGEVEYVEIAELELSVKVYLQFIVDFLSVPT